MIQRAASVEYAFIGQLDFCCKKIAEKITAKPINDWVNSDYVKLSVLLEQETRIRLSENTLKRIFGKVKTSGRYFPQEATRNALAQFAGYANWDDFIGSENLASPISNRSGLIRFKAGISRLPHLRTLSFVVLGCILALSICYIAFSNTPDPFLKTKLICKNPIGVSPYTAIFYLKLPKTGRKPAGKFIIDLNYLWKKPIEIVPGHLLTHYYEEPGRYYAKLVYNNKIIDTVRVHLSAAKWTATGRMLKDTNARYPVPLLDINRQKQLFVDARDVHNAGIDTAHSFFISFTKTIAMPVSGDNFDFYLYVHTAKQRPGVRASQIVVKIFGEKSNHSFAIMRPGCESWMYARFSENLRLGESSDLRALGASLEKGGSIRLENNHQSIQLFINNKKVYHIKYIQPIGKILGFHFTFDGVGTVNQAWIKNRSTGYLNDLITDPR